jgi:outer membrane protein insertion porin family
MIRQLTVKICFLLIIFFSFATVAQTIDSIDIKGNSNFSKEEYLKWINLSGKSFHKKKSDSIKAKIEFNLNKYGYLNSSVDSIGSVISPDSQKINLTLFVTEGKPTYINKILITDLDSVELKQITEKFAVLTGTPFVVAKLEEEFTDILTDFENDGYPFASIKVKSLFFFFDSIKKKNKVDISLAFKKNKISRIDTIIVKGNSTTKKDVIIRELRINKGEPYSQNKLEQIPYKLNRLRFFDFVQPPKYYFNSHNKGILEIEVKEKNTNSFDGILGYIPAQKENESGYFTGLINVSMRNLFGTGRGFSFRWSKLDKHSQELEIKYLEPWIFGLPFNLNLFLFQKQQDTTYVQRILSGSVEFLATENFSSSFVFSKDYTIPTNPEGNDFTVFNSTATNTGVNFKYDIRDNILVPTKGIYLLNTYKYSAKNINGPEKYISDTTNITPKQYRIELDLLLIKKIALRHIPFIGIHIRELQGDDIEISDMYRIGGNNTLRGYMENQFVGSRVIWTNMEYRYLTGRRSYLFLFVDMAYYKRKELKLQNLPEFSATKIGYGAGITFETELGMISVSYALAQGESFNKGKLHFGLIGEF